MLADIETIGFLELVVAAGTEETVETMRVVVGKICTTSIPFPTLSVAAFAISPDVALASGGTLPMPGNIASPNPAALEITTSRYTVWTAVGTVKIIGVVAGRFWAAGWSVSVEFEGRVRIGFRLELELELVW